MGPTNATQLGRGMMTKGGWLPHRQMHPGVSVDFEGTDDLSKVIVYGEAGVRVRERY